MPAPVTSPLFATDATFAADGDSWSGDPTKVDPGAPRRAEGYEPDTLPAEWLNFQIGLIGDWITWLEGQRIALTAEDASPRVFGIPCFRPENVAQWDMTFAGAGAGHLAAPTVNNALGRFDLEGIPLGATVTGVDVMIGTSVSRAAADRWQASLYHVNRDFPGLASGAVQLSTTIDDLGGATGIELMGWAGLSQVVGTGSAFFVQIEAPSGALAAGDYLYGVRVTYTRAL